MYAAPLTDTSQVHAHTYMSHAHVHNMSHKKSAYQISAGKRRNHRCVNSHAKNNWRARHERLRLNSRGQDGLRVVRHGVHVLRVEGIELNILDQRWPFSCRHVAFSSGVGGDAKPSGKPKNATKSEHHCASTRKNALVLSPVRASEGRARLPLSRFFGSRGGGCHRCRRFNLGFCCSRLWFRGHLLCLNAFRTLQVWLSSVTGGAVACVFDALHIVAREKATQIGFDVVPLKPAIFTTHGYKNFIAFAEFELVFICGLVVINCSSREILGLGKQHDKEFSRVAGWGPAWCAVTPALHADVEKPRVSKSVQDMHVRMGAADSNYTAQMPPTYLFLLNMMQQHPGVINLISN